jgi:hypothetical protein
VAAEVLGVCPRTLRVRGCPNQTHHQLVEAILLHLRAAKTLERIAVDLVVVLGLVPILRRCLF